MPTENPNTIKNARKLLMGVLDDGLPLSASVERILLSIGSLHHIVAVLESVAAEMGANE